MKWHTGHTHTERSEEALFRDCKKVQGVWTRQEGFSRLAPSTQSLPSELLSPSLWSGRPKNEAERPLFSCSCSVLVTDPADAGDKWWCCPASLWLHSTHSRFCEICIKCTPLYLVLASRWEILVGASCSKHYFFVLIVQQLLNRMALTTGTSESAGQEGSHRGGGFACTLTSSLLPGIVSWQE